jgi:Phage integrase family
LISSSRCFWDGPPDNVFTNSITLRVFLPAFFLPPVPFTSSSPAVPASFVLSVEKQYPQPDVEPSGFERQNGAPESSTTKNDATQMIILDGELLETIQKQWERRKVATIPGQSPTLLCPFVFHRDGKRIKDLRKAWDKARKATGLTAKIPHDFRRTAIRNMVRAGFNERVAMMISGHKTRIIFDRYIVSEEDLRDAARRTWEHAQSQEKESNIVPLRSNQEADAHSLDTIMGTVAHTSLKLLKCVGTNSLNIKGLVPGAGLEPARTLPGPRDFKSRVSTNSTIRA